MGAGSIGSVGQSGAGAVPAPFELKDNSVTRLQRANALACYLATKVGQQIDTRDMATALGVGHYKRVMWALQDLTESDRIEILPIALKRKPVNAGDLRWYIVRADHTRLVVSRPGVMR